MKSAIAALRGFGMAVEEALEEWDFDQNLFKEAADPVEVPAKVRPGRKQKKEQDAAAEDRETTNPKGDLYRGRINAAESRHQERPGPP